VRGDHLGRERARVRPARAVQSLGGGDRGEVGRRLRGPAGADHPAEGARHDDEQEDDGDQPHPEHRARPALVT